MYRTLIVDDEPLMRTYLANNLTAICPFFSVTGIASDGKEAMYWLQKQRFDLVITGIRMPEMDGLGLSKYIYEAFPRTKVIILSGYNEFEYARRCIADKGNHVLIVAAGLCFRRPCFSADNISGGPGRMSGTIFPHYNGLAVIPDLCGG